MAFLSGTWAPPSNATMGFLICLAHSKYPVVLNREKMSRRKDLFCFAKVERNKKKLREMTHTTGQFVTIIFNASTHHNDAGTSVFQVSLFP